jgi:hypothetical protein
VTVAHAARLVALAAVCVACAPEGEEASEEAAATCRIVQPSRPLPPGLPESSGLAVSRAHDGILWTHNDSGDRSEVFAVDAAGGLHGVSNIVGARNDDWEDIAVGPCAAGSCLYVADTGDNERKREETYIYRVVEPEPGSPSARAERLTVRYPDHPRDTEAIFVLPPGDVYLVTKGRQDSQTLYRYRPGTVEKIVDLAPGPAAVQRQITAASASPSGEWVAIREYKLLSIYRTADLLARKTTPALRMDLTSVGEAQGEGVALLDNGRVVLSSEGGFKDSPGTIAILQCQLPT